MRHLRDEGTARAWFACLALLCGTAVSAAPAPLPRARPLPPEMLAALERSTGWVSGLMRARVDLDLYVGAQSVGMSGHLGFDRSGRYRLKLSVLGRPVADVGSNEKEAWLVFQEQSARLARSPGKAAPRGGASWPLPFHPDWLPAVLGLADYRRLHSYQVVERGRLLDVTEKLVDPAGKPVQKITVVEKAGNGGLRVAAVRLEDARGEVIVSGSVLAFQRDARSGLDVPVRLTLAWPARKVKMTMYLSDVGSAGPAQGEMARRLFGAPPW